MNRDAHAIETSLRDWFARIHQIAIPDAGHDLFQAGIVDSLRFVELLVFIESEYGVPPVMSDLQIENFRTLRDIVGYVISGIVGRAAAQSDSSRSGPRLAQG
jgi:acyl carrier protein